MARTTAAAVRGILGGDYDGKRDLSPFIETATDVVDEVLVKAAASDPVVTISTTRAELIERWLSAHYYACSDRTYESKSTGRASAKFTGKTEMYLKATIYGQQAMQLDPSGWLQAIGSGEERKVASAVWLGTEETTET